MADQPQAADETPSKYGRKACAGLRQELIDCLLASDCVQKHGRTPKECLKKENQGVPYECRTLQNSFFECKRSLLDNRTRFRGSKGY
ncbi:Cytochrome c oxidase assembly factor 5 [Trichoplax sp. H2]|uniref:Cytochrome c oxidase assembly factor 5 n=1 Tax=Trichoplax adhaerens TaxID=10228 RepID=B3S9Q7_TRIAD|nr:hypothetical protein TRIADDRAFT_31742 [Trichoplax adhaerens]EDV20577.1 hypothetical protein TRIADDRAFT_31742 [Trichoplax adhaerens]RDD37546.1 Cytochrome c oxidase assembly factor 5 [Trichoplax sp. H2]|eukprot:XP_002117003.1 hypothetical protein TRIADDRAFT_31742 [Trichoplax adhaerens]